MYLIKKKPRHRMSHQLMCDWTRPWASSPCAGHLSLWWWLALSCHSGGSSSERPGYHLPWMGRSYLFFYPCRERGSPACLVCCQLAWTWYTAGPPERFVKGVSENSLPGQDRCFCRCSWTTPLTSLQLTRCQTGQTILVFAYILTGFQEIPACHYPVK